jgi:hypothetical protein
MRFGVFVGLALLLGAGWFAAYLWPGKVRCCGCANSSWGPSCCDDVHRRRIPPAGPIHVGGSLGDVLRWIRSLRCGTRGGKVWVARCCSAVGCSANDGPHRGPLPGRFGASGWSLAISATPLSGHVLWPVDLFALPADMFHVLGMAVWLGGLVMSLSPDRRELVAPGWLNDSRAARCRRRDHCHRRVPSAAPTLTLRALWTAITGAS